MYRFIQFDAATGAMLGSMDRCELDAEGRPVAPEGKVVIDSEARPEARSAAAYDAATDTFTERPAPAAMITKADVIAALTPAQWAEACRFHPTSEGTAPSGTPYNDPEVFWAVSVFTAATRPFPANDPRIGVVLEALVRGRVLSTDDALALRQRLSGR